MTAKMQLEDIQFIINHFENQTYPRTISTKTTQGKQIEVYSIEEVIPRFKQANFIDCRINAYPSYTNYQGINRQSPNLVMCDLDIGKFRTEHLLLKALYKTTENIVKDLGQNAKPTVLFTGNGYHVYQPISLPVLEQDSIFESYEKVSTEFIRYAAQRWTEGKNDPYNHPSVNSCLIRVPNSINSKNNKTVEIIESWNGIRPPANSMLFDFQIELAAKKLAFKARINRTSRGRGQTQFHYNNTYFTQGKRFHRCKTYRHFGYTNRTESYHTIDWIGSLLLGSGMGDCRKITIELVLAPYLINVKKCDFDIAYNTIANWLDKCGKIRRLDFTARARINYALKHANYGPALYPMRLDTIKSKYPEMYAEVFA
jgi:hypothetical protein